MNCNVLKNSLALSVVLSAALAVSSTQAHDDILVSKVDGGTKTGIGAIEVAENEGEPGVRLFEGLLIAGDGGNDFARDEPGINAPSSLNPLYGVGGDLTAAGNSPLTAGETVNFSLRTFKFNGAISDLFYWDGSGSVNFTPSTATPSLSASSTIAGTNGFVDFHTDFEINEGSGAQEGVYLMSFNQQITGTDVSDAAFIVWLADDTITDETIAEDTEELIEDGLAFEFFEEAVDHVASVIPEPNTLALALLGVFGAMGRFRR